MNTGHIYLTPKIAIATIQLRVKELLSMDKEHVNLNVLQVMVSFKMNAFLALICLDKDALPVTMKNPAKNVIIDINYHKKMEDASTFAL